MDLKSNLDAPLLENDTMYAKDAENAMPVDVKVDQTVSIHQAYAHVAPKILLEVMTARTLTIVLGVTYLTFALAFFFDVRSTIQGYRNNNRKAGALSCDLYNRTTAFEAIDSFSEFGCTFNETSSEPAWIGQFTDLDNIISVSLELEIRNISSSALDNIDSGVFEYNVLLYGCYDSSNCRDWIEVLSMKNEALDFSDAYDSANKNLKFTLIGNTFQNQEALPARGIVKSYAVLVNYAVEGVGTVSSLDNFKYKFETIDRQSNKATDILTVIMQIFTIGFTVWFCNAIYKSSADSEVLPEQYWVIYYLIALILFQNPVYCVICWVNDPEPIAVYSYYIVDSLSQAAFYVIWLLFADGLQRNNWKALFYIPKLVFGLTIFASSVVVLTYQFPSLSPDIDRNPLLAVYNWSGETKKVLVGFCVVFLFLLWFWTLWWFYKLYQTGDSLKRVRYMDSRYLQLSFRFFSLQATLVTLYYIFQYFVVIYFILSRSSEGWVNDLNSVADTINTLFRQQTQNFGKITFLTVYGIILAIFFIPVGWFKYDGLPALEATYVVTEEEVMPLRRHRKRVIKAMGKVGNTLTKTKADVLCLDIALEMMELSYEAYYDPSGQSTESGFGIMNLERHGYLLLDSMYYAETDTVCYICRNVVKNRVVVVFRGTSSKKHWTSNLDYGKIEINMERDYKLVDLDMEDGLSLESIDANTSDIDSESSSVDKCISDEPEDRNTFSGLVESTMSKAGTQVTHAASFVGAASSNAFDATFGATADVMMRTAQQTPLLKNAFACSVHRGFWMAYLPVREFIHRAVRRELSVNPCNIYFTGHSLGGALATLASLDVSIHSVPRINKFVKWAHDREINRRSKSEHDIQLGSIKAESWTKVRVGMYNFGSPRVGNGNFAVLYDNKVPNAFRIAVDGDIVTGIPPKTARYKHVGTTVVIDGSGTGSVIIDPSFVERRLQFSSKSSVKAHFLNYYRIGLSGAKRASEEIRVANLAKRSQPKKAKNNIFIFPSAASLRSGACDSVVPDRTLENKLSAYPHADPIKDDEEYVRQMEQILTTYPSMDKTSILKSMKSVLWQSEKSLSAEGNTAGSVDDVDGSSEKRLKMKHLTEN